MEKMWSAVPNAIPVAAAEAALRLSVVHTMRAARPRRDTLSGALETPLWEPLP